MISFRHQLLDFIVYKESPLKLMLSWMLIGAQRDFINFSNINGFIPLPLWLIHWNHEHYVSMVVIWIMDNILLGESCIRDQRYEIGTWPKNGDILYIYDSLLDKLDDPEVFPIQKMQEHNLCAFYILHWLLWQSQFFDGMSNISGRMC